MSYLIMECAASYAVALDEEGRFVRVPNLGYEVGQEVDDVVIFDEGQLLAFEARKARRTRGRRARAPRSTPRAWASGLRSPAASSRRRAAPSAPATPRAAARTSTSCSSRPWCRTGPGDARLRAPATTREGVYATPRGYVHRPSCAFFSAGL